MNSEEFKNELETQLIPDQYRTRVIKNIPESWLVLKKGAYAFACLPLSEPGEENYSNSYVKKVLRKALKAFPVFLEKGVFILYYGSREMWVENYQHYKVDKTALRPIIVQAIHFFDLDTGENINTRTSWGPIKFGFCGPTIEKIELIGKKIKH